MTEVKEPRGDMGYRPASVVSPPFVTGGSKRARVLR